MVLTYFFALAMAPSSLKAPKILTCIAGLHRCIGLENGMADAWGCNVSFVSACSGKPEDKPCGACTSRNQINLACAGQDAKNLTGKDGTPVTFNLPVDVDSIKPEFFEWVFADGSTRPVSCVIPRGAPANEPNELQTLALIGDSGGWDGQNAIALKVVGDLMLVQANGTKVSAKGLEYSGSALDYKQGVMLLSAIFEEFSLQGEILHNPPILPIHTYPNHCRALFPSTTHRLRLLFDGGVSLDGLRPITPDRVDLFHVLNIEGQVIPQDFVLGLADLGAPPLPQTPCEKEIWPTDGDNYLDICLKIPTTDVGPAVAPAAVHMPCGPTSQISAPKGSKYPCSPQTINVSSLSTKQPTEKSKKQGVEESKTGAAMSSVPSLLVCGIVITIAFSVVNADAI